MRGWGFGARGSSPLPRPALEKPPREEGRSYDFGHSPTRGISPS